MNEPQKTRKRALPPPPLRQISMAFETIRLHGLTSAERKKVVIRLAQVLTLAAGVAIEERDDER
jgi:hypothetical protein